VNKVVINNNGGTKVIADFPLFIDGSSVTSGVARTTSVGLHTVSETSNSGYVATIGGDCAANGTITLALGDVKTCTITNDDIAPVVVPPPAPITPTPTPTSTPVAPTPVVTPTSTPVVAPIVSPTPTPTPTPVPQFPNTGIAPDEKSMPWNILIPAGLFAVLASFYLARRKQTA
jgi:hypothetical protein